jgi:hypothetical protein
MFLLVFRINGDVIGILYDMRDVIVAPVGKGGAKVRKVKRGASDLSLTDRQGYDGGGFPFPSFVNLVIVF